MNTPSPAEIHANQYPDAARAYVISAANVRADLDHRAGSRARWLAAQESSRYAASMAGPPEDPYRRPARDMFVLAHQDAKTIAHAEPDPLRAQVIRAIAASAASAADPRSTPAARAYWREMRALTAIDEPSRGA